MAAAVFTMRSSQARLLDDIFGTLVEGAQIVLTVPPGVRVDVLGKRDAEIRDGRILVSMGPLQNDIERVAVFKSPSDKLFIFDRFFGA